MDCTSNAIKEINHLTALFISILSLQLATCILIMVLTTLENMEISGNLLILENSGKTRGI